MELKAIKEKLPPASIDDVKMLEIKNILDPNGSLGVVEAHRHIPFDIKRLFYVFGVNAGDTRGQHAHIQCHQVLICVRGLCHVVCDDGMQKKTFVLDSPIQGLHIPPGIWAEQQYDLGGTVLLVLCDRWFSESDYVREYQRFRLMRGQS